MDHPCRNNPEGLLFQSVERSIWCVRLFFDKQWKRRTAKLFWFVHAHAFFFYGSGSPLSATFSALEPGSLEPGGEWGLRAEEVRTSDRSGRGLARGLISSLEARRLRLCASAWLEHRAWCLAYRPGEYVHLIAARVQMWQQCANRFLLTFVPLCLAFSHLCGCAQQGLEVCHHVSRQRWRLSWWRHNEVVRPGWLAYGKTFFHVHRTVFLFCSTWSCLLSVFVTWFYCLFFNASCLNEKVLSILLSAPHASRAATISRRYRLGRRHNSTNVKIDALTTRIVVMVNY